MMSQISSSNYSSTLSIEEDYKSEENDNAGNPVPITLKENQSLFIIELFKSQELPKKNLALQLNNEVSKKANLEIQNQKVNDMLLRHADALIHSIISKFIKLLSTSPNLQALLHLKKGNMENIDAATLIERMGQLLEEEVPPLEFSLDPLTNDFVWCPRGLEVLQPIFNDMEQFLKLFGVTDVTSHCPKSIENILNEEFKKGLTPEAADLSKLQIAGKGIKFTLGMLWFICGLSMNATIISGVALLVLKGPSISLIEMVAKALFKIVFSYVI